MRRKPPKLVAVAIANKTARVAWAVLTRDEIYRSQATNRHPSTRETAARAIKRTETNNTCEDDER